MASTGERTLSALAEEAKTLCNIAMDAKEGGIEVGRLLAIGGYSTVFMAKTPGREHCVLKIPWLPPQALDEHPDVVDLGHGPLKIECLSPTGPFCLHAPTEGTEAEELLASVAEKQLKNPSPRLAELYSIEELGGVKTAVMEFVNANTLRWKIKYWPEEAKELIGHLANSLLELHRTFGPHGDLKPNHIFLTNDGVKFIDPLVPNRWIGSIGYALPLLTEDKDESLEKCMFMRDLGALAQMIAEMWGGSFHWDGRLIYLLVNQFNGRFGRGLNVDSVKQFMLDGTDTIDEPIRSWVREVGLALWEKAMNPKSDDLDAEEKLLALIKELPQVS